MLPWADEIRAARAKSLAAQAAKSELDTVDLSLREMEARRAVLERLGQDIDPTYDARRQTLLERREALAPEVAALLPLNEELSRLLAAQHESLHQPGHEATITAIKALGRERQEIWDELEPVWQRVKVIEPVAQLIEDHLEALSSRGSADWAATRTANLLRGIQETLAVIHYDIGLPEAPAPDWDALDETAERLRALRDLLAEERTELQARHRDKRVAYDALTDQIQAITG